MLLLKMNERIRPEWFDTVAAGTYSPEEFAAALAKGTPGQVTEQQLAKINAMPGVLEPLAAKDLIVLGVSIVNDKPFKDGRRRFRPAALAQIVERMPGVKPVINHPIFATGIDALGIGNTFDAGLFKDQEGVTWVRALFYMLRAWPWAEPLAAAIKGGQISEASIGVTFATFECSICKDDIGECEHMPGINYGKKGVAYGEIDDIKDVMEWSLVVEGMVDGTNFFLAAGRAGESEAVDVEEIERAAAENAKVAPLTRYFRSKPKPRDPWGFLRKQA